MARSNQPFKRPNLSSSDEYERIPPPPGQSSSFVAPVNQTQIPAQGANQPVQQVFPPSQEEITWALQLEEMVQKKGYRPSDPETARYQDIANRVTNYQSQVQAQAQQQARVKATPEKKIVVKTERKFNFFSFTLKIFILSILVLLFFAKVTIVNLVPCNFEPRGKIYFLIKPQAFSQIYYTFNMDKVYKEKFRNGFTKDDLNLDDDNNKKINSKWYIDPEYWEDNYILAVPHINLSLKI